MSEILKDLQRQIAERRAVLVVGTGVSVAASGREPVASWVGLLEHGVGRCLEVGASIPDGWKERRLGDIRSGDTGEMISAAEQIVDRLGGVESSEYRRWLRETVGALTPKDRGVLEAIRDLGLPLATTNYDGLLEEVTGWPAVSWKEPERALQVLRGEEKAVLHLHGFWRDPTSVVLGGGSYEQVLRDVPAQSVQQMLGLLHSLVFVGFGAGLADPNFGALLKWLRQHWSRAEHRHFRLCLERDEAELRATHHGDRVFPVAYGAEHSALGPWLRGLKPGLSTGAVPRAAVTASPPISAPADLVLRTWPEQPLPSRPYPLLLPYEHPALFAGRERELANLRGLVDLPVPILGLFALSGAGKSSLLAAGLVPLLRSERVPVAFDRRPTEAGLAGRLLGDLFEPAGLEARDMAEVETNPVRFADLLREARRLAGRPPVMVLDQFEDLFRGSESQRARRTVGLLLAATIQRLPGESAPLCRWVLACRRDFHGELAAWLPDVLREARAEGVAGLETLPFDLFGQERFHSWDLPALGSPPPGASAADARQVAESAFLAAIVKPLEATDEKGQRVFRWTIQSDAAQRLAGAFAKAREQDPGTPLVPQLQVVLARLLDEAGEGSSVGNLASLNVPEDPGRLIESALEGHLRRALDRAFPAGRAVNPREGRSRALLALRELADEHGRTGEGLSASDIARAVGPDGEKTLATLEAPECRILVPVPGPEGLRYTLSHDRLAQVVRNVVDEETRRGLVDADQEILELRRFVTHQAQFFAAGERESAVRISSKRYQAIARRSEALLWDQERRGWWEACGRERRAKRRRKLAWAAAVVVASLVAAPLVDRWFSQFQDLSVHSARVERAPAADAFESAWLLSRDHHKPPSAISPLIQSRKDLHLFLEGGPGRLQPEEERPEAMLRVVEALLPALQTGKLDTETIATLTWTLDYFPARDQASPSNRRQAQELRKEIEAALRKQHGEPPSDGFAWVGLEGGSFQMGSPAGEGGGDEESQHRVTVSPFRMLATEVTNRQLRRVFSDVEGPDELPAVNVSWYKAYAFATWLGGRLPTEAEWEYAARAGCPHPYCDRRGSATTLDKVGWYDANSGGKLQPVGQKEPNPWGLYDLYGNTWEWTASWYAPYSAADQADPWGPPLGELRVIRGGSAWDAAVRARAAFRNYWFPRSWDEDRGFRVVLPAVPEP